MFRLLSTLVRGAAAEAEDTLFDANAIRILEQQLRDAAQSLEHAKRELACAMAHRSAEAPVLDTLEKRISELEPAIRDALAAGREDLAEETAVAVASAENDMRERKTAVARFDGDITRLRRLTDDGRQRLLDLRRGLEMARAEEALRKAGAHGRRAALTGAGALREAEATLTRIRLNQATDADTAAAMDVLERTASGADLDARLADAGFGDRKRVVAADVLARFRSAPSADFASADAR